MKTIIYILILFIFVQCETKNKINKQTVLNSFEAKLLIRSPGECTQMIIWDSSRRGLYIKGGVNQTTLYEDFVDFNYIVEEKKFFFTIEKFNIIKDIIKNINDKELSSSPIRKDGFRYQLFIYNYKKIDVYGIQTDDLKLLLSYLESEIPNIDHLCW